MNLKSLFLAAALALPVLASAQIKAPVKVGLRFGVNTSNISETRISPGKTISHEPAWKPGFTVGAVIDIPLRHNFYLTPGFYYDYRHNEYKLNYTKGLSNEVMVHRLGSVTTNWFQIPMLASYRIPLSVLEFQFDFGPYLALGLGGRDNVKDTEFGGPNGYLEYEEVKHNAFGYGSDSRYFNIDWGFDFGVGLLIAKHYYIGAHYLIGARNLALNKEEISKAHSHQWQFSVGFNF